MTRQDIRRAAGVLALYLLIAAIYTHPLLTQGGSRIANDTGDPILNTAILWWNAVTLPFSTTWWSPPYFYPSADISAFTENLVGISPFASPIYWITGNPLLAYNVSLYLTWPLSAFAAYLIVVVLTKRHDAGFLAGLAYAFSPYRIGELGHLQSLSTYWIAFAIAGLHAYLLQRRVLWLVFFGAAWVLQSLANMYLLMYGAVFVGLWLAYFCTTRERMRVGATIVGVWFLASLPLIPILLKYRSVHEHYGLRRDMAELAAYSTPVQAWLETSSLVRFWSPLLASGTDNLFPGLTALVVVGVCLIVLARRKGPAPPYRRTRIGLSLVLALSLVAIALTVKWGPWESLIAGMTIKMSNVNRAVGLLLISGAALMALTPRVRQALARRDPLVFYVAATAAMALLSCGTVIRTGDQIIFESGPYRWLLAIPGFTGLRVVTRFWMPGVLALSVAAGLAFMRMKLGRTRWRPVIVGALSVGFLADGWLSVLPMAEAPTLLAIVEPPGEPRPILELPIGPGFDAAPTYRSIGNGRPMVNGVSGYDPAHYDPLRAGLNSHDPETLRALASYGSIDVVIDGNHDPSGEWAKYVSEVAGEDPIFNDGVRTTYRIPETRIEDPVLGQPVPIVGVEAFRHDPSVIVDGRMDTEWGDNPQRRGQWVLADLGSPHVIGGLTHGLGEYARDFPRRLVIEVSVDGKSWDRVWQGNTNAMAFRAAVESPRYAVMRFTFDPRPARFVRLRQTADHQNMWRISELQVHAPAER